MFPHQGGPGQLPTHWQPPSSQQPANGAYNPPPAHISTSLPPPPPREPRPDMAAHHHPHHHPQQQQQQQQYRLPGPHEWTRGPPPQDPYQSQPQPQPPNYMGHPGQHQAPAPRQRTAIACRYCRRRKIRCSGFEQTDDGRCSNCMRFNQDCIFTPVSAQTQAFVPAHTVWRGVGQPPPMYGAYGQPLPPSAPGDAYGQPPRGQPQQYLPSPTGQSGPYPAHYGPPPGAPYDEDSRDSLQSRKRPSYEPHTPTLPPPNPASVSQLPHRGARQDYAYPDPTSLTAASPAPSVASSAASYPPAPPPASQPYYATQPPRRTSPQSASAYSYDGRSSSSPRTQGPTTPSASPYFAGPTPNGALQPLPPRNDGRTPPPPTSSSSNRPGMRINDLVDNGNSRNSTDSSMLNMLNRRPM
ncbi:hypothetical protein K505DRAFT_368965 [Melanomma pulvis-pyrius CBS 109.77]|uniref:Zn(2)-C6 fungal-type domain-containing protein n=1 Tax=Melanomma pulvis-pyrius CBS 109.77 TaxID=1314802 RepID=A0A6A6WNZ7_9PLEO|nr:hypothetical protein K505DRAFT_368965 [Melanomma pulvis-pyrius CBS 109.77]